MQKTRLMERYEKDFKLKATTKITVDGAEFEFPSWEFVRWVETASSKTPRRKVSTKAEDEEAAFITANDKWCEARASLVSCLEDSGVPSYISGALIANFYSFIDAQIELYDAKRT